MGLLPKFVLSHKAETPERPETSNKVHTTSTNTCRWKYCNPISRGGEYRACIHRENVFCLPMHEVRHGKKSTQRSVSHPPHGPFFPPPPVGLPSDSVDRAVRRRVGDLHANVQLAADRHDVLQVRIPLTAAPLPMSQRSVAGLCMIVRRRVATTVVQIDQGFPAS